MTNLYSFRPEEELLLCCARTEPNIAAAERIRELLHGKLDWEQVDALATRHKIQLLLFWNLKQYAADQVPAATLTALQEQYMGNAWLNHHFSREVVNLVRVFGACHIPVIPLKGVTLAASVYGNLALRHAGDIDILIPEQDIPRAKALLMEQGFQGPAMTAAEEAAYLQAALHFAFSRPGTRATVELHWDIHPKHIPHQFDFEAVWRRTERVDLGGTPVATLPPDDLLPYLCNHAGGHRWSNLRWVCDIAEAIRCHQPNLDWEKMAEQATTEGTRRMFLLGLSLAHRLLDAPLPKVVNSWLEADPGLQSLAARESARLFQNVDPPDQDDIKRFLYRLKTLDNPRARIRYIRHILAPHNTTGKKFSLPRPLSFLYYLLRPVRFSLKYALNRLKSVREV